MPISATIPTCDDVIARIRDERAAARKSGRELTAARISRAEYRALTKNHEMNAAAVDLRSRLDLPVEDLSSSLVNWMTPIDLIDDADLTPDGARLFGLPVEFTD